MLLSVAPRLRIRLACCALVLGILAPAARAADDQPGPDLAGTYALSGSFSNGKEYTGTLRITKMKTVTLRKGPSYDLWQLAFHYSSGWSGIGMGLWIDNRLCFVLAHDGKKAMVNVYRPLVLSPELQELQAKYDAAERKADKKHFVELKGDPWYGDIWTGQFYSIFTELDADWGAAELWGERGHAELGEGKFEGDEVFYSDKGKNQSLISDAGFALEVTKQDGDAYKIVRHIKHGGQVDKKIEPWEGIGLMPDAHTLVVVTGGNDSQGVGYFDVAGKTLSGHVADQGSTQSYVQVATPTDDVVARNSSVFH